MTNSEKILLLVNSTVLRMYSQKAVPYIQMLNFFILIKVKKKNKNKRKATTVSVQSTESTRATRI